MHPSVIAGLLEIETVDAAGQRLRIGRRAGKKGITPLLLFNGVGANLELVGPFIAELDASIPAVMFDVPGVGGSPAPHFPYRLSGVARLGDRLTLELGSARPIDVLGVSWGGAVGRSRICLSVAGSHGLDKLALVTPPASANADFSRHR